MAGEASLDDVLLASLVSPDGTSFQVISGSLPRKHGLLPDTASFNVFAPSRFRQMLEFDGSFTPIAQGELDKFSRAPLPKPSAGTKLSSVGWKLFVDPGQGERVFEVNNLILIAADVERGNLAESAQGPLIPDNGQDRREVWRLALTDTRVLWRGTGHMAGKRNFHDRVSSLRVGLKRDSDILEITSPKIGVASGPGLVTVLGSIKNTIGIPQIGIKKNGDLIPDEFDPLSLKDRDFFTTKDLLIEIAERLPFLTPYEDGEKVGPAEILDELDKLILLDVDYGVASSGAKALETIIKGAGLIVGIQFDGRLFVEFDTAPSEKVFRASGLIERQARWSEERRGARVRPKSPSVRFYPNRLLKEIVTTDFIRAAKQSDGTVVPLKTLANQLKISEGHLAYLSAVKAEVERPGERDELEQKFDEDISGPATAVPEFSNTIRIVSDSAARSFLYAPDKTRREFISAKAVAARKRAQEKFDIEAKAAEDFGAGGKIVGTAPIQTFRFDSETMLDAMLSTPLKVVTNVPRLGTQQPVFLGDAIFHRLYDFILTGSNIVEASFVQAPPSPIPPIPSGFQQNIFDALINKEKYFGKEIDPDSPEPQFSSITIVRDPQTGFESFQRNINVFSRPILGRKLDRRPADWEEAHAKEATMQSTFRQFLATREMILPSNRLSPFWEGGAGKGDPLEVFLTWVSTDVTKYRRTFDADTGFVEFSITLGLFPEGSISMRNALSIGAIFLRKRTDEIESALLFPPSPQTVVLLPPTIQSQLFWTWASKLNIILDEDKRETKKVEDVLAEVNVTGPAAGPEEFLKKFERFLQRNPGQPIWQIASLKTANEIEKLQPDATGPDEFPVIPGIEPPEEEEPAIGAPVASTEQPTGTAPGSGTGNNTTTRDVDLDTTALTVPDVEISEKLPELAPGKLLARLWIEVPFNEATWPRVDIGGSGPARVVKINVPWVEDFRGNRITEADFIRVAVNKFSELHSASTVEETEELEIGGVFKVEMGSIVRQVFLTWGDGGSSPRTRVSSTLLTSRRLPFLRALEAEKNRLGAGIGG